MKILGIESSCDETGAAVVEGNGDGLELLSNALASSADLHRQYGGVVPEIAARSHIEAINPVINQALLEAKYGQGVGLDGVQGNKEKRTNRTNGTKSESRTQLTQQSGKSTGSVLSSAQKQTGTPDDLWDDIDAIAVTYGPGLGGSLLVGVLTARTLAILHNKPLYGVNHVLAHTYAAFITGGRISGYQLASKPPEFPLLALIVSGGPTQLVYFEDHFKYSLLGTTSDDAVGEAYDKTAKILGLPYPGGPSVEKLAFKGDPDKYTLPKPKTENKYGFSYSGLKTAVLRLAQKEISEDYGFPSHKIADRLSGAQQADIAACFNQVAIEILVDKTRQACEEYDPKSVIIAGGVSASPELRKQMKTALKISPVFADPKLCTDNGAMIAAAGYFMKLAEISSSDPRELDIAPGLSM